MGSTGEYSNRQEWPVLAFGIESAAQSYADKAGQRARALYHALASPYDMAEGRNEYDALMRMDYTGTSYWVMQVQMAQEELDDGREEA